MKYLDKQYFSQYHPLIVFSYFCLVLTIIMFSTNPIIRGMSVAIGLYNQWHFENLDQKKKI